MGGNSPLKPGAISTKHPKGTPLREYASKFSENPNFGAWWLFPAFSSQTGEILTVSYYRNYCIDFNPILHNDRDHQVVVVGGRNRRPRNLRWRTAVILKKPVWPILIRFGTVTHMGKISNFWKSKMAAAAILKNHKNRDISATVWPIFMTFGTLMQNATLNCSDR